MRSANFVVVTVLGMMLWLVGISTASTVTHHYTFSALELVDTDDGVQLVMENTRLLGVPGEPLLPVFGVSLLLPPGEEIVDVEVIPGTEFQLPGSYFVIPTEREYPLSQMGPYDPVGPDPQAYQSDAPYPAHAVTNFSTHFYRGYSIGYAAVVPVVYRPESGRVTYYTDMEVVLHTQGSSRAGTAFTTMLRNDRNTMTRLAGKVQNSERISAYPALDTGREIATDYLIITNSALMANFQDLADFKDRRGVKTLMETVGNIVATQPGFDTQDKIRNYIIDAYTTEGIEYVLLAGDDEIIPHRGFYANPYSTPDDDIAADLYYGALDGNWNNDGDSWWGEPGEDDLLIEVAVGRAAVDSPTEADNFIYKQIMYQQSPVLADCDDFVFVGEELWSDVYCEWTFGKTYLEEIRLGSSNHGYTTVGIPAYFQYQTLYDLDICPSAWSATSDLMPIMNSGINFINHLGHSNVTYCMRMYNSSVTDANFTNNGINRGFYNGYSQGCYDGSFDNRTTSGTYTEDCIGEAFTTIENCMVTFVGNSRYGWGMHNSTNGSSNYFDRQFVDAIFGEDITRVAPANDDSREDNIWNITYGANRWVYYELTVFGDPELDFWTAVPTAMVPTYQSAYVIGQDTIQVSVSTVEGALVALSFNGVLVGRGTTDATGNVDVVLDEPPGEPGMMGLVITAHDYLEYSDSVQVIPPTGPYVLYRSHTVNDAGGNGNNNGLLDFGEEVGLTITMENVGNDNVEGVTVTLTSDDPYVTITDGTEYYGNIASHAQASVIDGFALTVASDVPDNYIVILDVTSTSVTLQQWEDDFNIVAHAPTVSIMTFDIDDATGNGNGRLDPNETVTVDVTLSNTGSADVSSLIGNLSTDYTHVSITSSMATLASLPAQQNGLLAPEYGVQVSGAAPNFSRAVFYLGLGGIRDYNSTLLYEVTVGGFYEDVESGAAQWSHAGQPGWGDQWHISTEDNYSPTHAWKCGDTGTGYYDNLLDAVLLTPTITLPSNTELTFWHWMSAEKSGYYADSAYDGGIVEISANSGPWQQLTPEGGYTHHIRHIAGGSTPYSGPFTSGIPCFSGDIDWEQVAVNLSSYSGDVQIRFRFGSDVADTLEGWYIDDIEILLADNLDPPENLQGQLIGTYAHLSWNSPGASGRGLLGYNVYRNSVQIATEVQSNSYQDNLAGMPPGIYDYVVTAVYDAGESAPTSPVSINFSTVPEAVDDLVVAVAGSNIILTWGQTSGAEEYNVYRGTDPFADPGDMTLITTTSATNYVDMGVVNGVEAALFYVVTASN